MELEARTIDAVKHVKRPVGLLQDPGTDRLQTVRATRLRGQQDLSFPDPFHGVTLIGDDSNPRPVRSHSAWGPFGLWRTTELNCSLHEPIFNA